MWTTVPTGVELSGTSFATSGNVTMNPPATLPPTLDHPVITPNNKTRGGRVAVFSDNSNSVVTNQTTFSNTAPASISVNPNGVLTVNSVPAAVVNRNFPGQDHHHPVACGQLLIQETQEWLRYRESLASAWSSSLPPGWPS